ncbi:MAG TPA: hypothetical protein VNN18_02165 [Candidatus Xenobia bacterium]|nr:hypothetical protein [Candidatus Xenobia bacterium]
MKLRLAALSVLLMLPAALAAQVRVEVGPAAKINVTYTEPADAGQADRLREVAARVKGPADQLDPLQEINLVIVHSQRELDQRLGPEAEGRLAGVSYVHGILFLSPNTWTRNPTGEALDHEMQEALIRYNVQRLAGGNRIPFWLEDGLVSLLGKRPFSAASGEAVAERAPLLLVRFEPEDPAVGYWAVRYLVEQRGGLASLRQLLRLSAQRPDSFVENLQLTYGVPVGELEREWRRWLQALVDADKRQRETGVKEGPLVRPKE